jgi:hypothetical protein
MDGAFVKNGVIAGIFAFVGGAADLRMGVPYHFCYSRREDKSSPAHKKLTQVTGTNTPTQRKIRP